MRKSLYWRHEKDNFVGNFSLSKLKETLLKIAQKYYSRLALFNDIKFNRDIFEKDANNEWQLKFDRA